MGHQTTQEKQKEAARHGSPGPRLPGERNGAGLLEMKLAIQTMAGWVPLFTSEKLVSGKVISKEPAHLPDGAGSSSLPSLVLNGLQ